MHTNEPNKDFTVVNYWIHQHVPFSPSTHGGDEDDVDYEGLHDRSLHIPDRQETDQHYAVYFADYSSNSTSITQVWPSRPNQTWQVIGKVGGGRLRGMKDTITFRGGTTIKKQQLVPEAGRDPMPNDVPDGIMFMNMSNDIVLN